MIAIVMVFEQDVLLTICGYALQCGGCLDEEESFYDQLNNEKNMHGVDDLIV